MLYLRSCLSIFGLVLSLFLFLTHFILGTQAYSLMVTFHPGSALAASHLHCPKSVPTVMVQCLSSLTCTVGTDVRPFSHPEAYMAVLWEAFSDFDLGAPLLPLSGL